MERDNQGTEEKETGRMEAFSDGVFAIAITLLALDLKVPNLESTTPGALARALFEKWPNYLILLLSFSTILIMWVYHHRLGQLVKRAETELLFANGLLLLLVTVVPFPTALVAEYLTTPAASVACATYAGFFALINLSYNLFGWVVSRQQAASQREGKHLTKSLQIIMFGFPCYLIAAALAFWLPALTLIICAALWIVWVITAPTPDDV